MSALVSKVCVVCLATHGLRRCAKCMRVHYCSVECQKKDWKVHQTFCTDFNKTTKEEIAISKANNPLNKLKNEMPQVYEHLLDRVSTHDYTQVLLCEINDAKTIFSSLPKQVIIDSIDLLGDDKQGQKMHMKNLLILLDQASASKEHIKNNCEKELVTEQGVVILLQWKLTTRPPLVYYCICHV